MEETRKVNWKNVSIVLGIGILGTIVGIADRIVNLIRPIEDVYLILSTSVAAGSTAPEAAQWYNTSASLAMNASSGFDLFGLLIIAIIGGAAMSMTIGFCSMGGRG